MRATLGITRPDSLRSLLKAAVFVERERVVSAALDGAIHPEQSRGAAAAHALRLIDAVDPPLQAEVTLSADDLHPEGVSSMGLRELRALAESIGLAPPPATE